jgi:hypothetical protein
VPISFAGRVVAESRMYTKQISVFLENQKGRLADVTKVLRDEGINIRALCLADTGDYGVLRLIVNDGARCLRILKAHDMTAQETDVLAVEIEDKPGSLHRIVEVLGGEGINLEYVYTFYEKKGDRVIVVFKCTDATRAADALKKGGIPILPEDMIQNL